MDMQIGELYTRIRDVNDLTDPAYHSKPSGFRVICETTFQSREEAEQFIRMCAAAPLLLDACYEALDTLQGSYDRQLAYSDEIKTLQNAIAATEPA